MHIHLRELGSTLSINDDIERLKDEFAESTKIIDLLKRQIHRELQQHRLSNGGRVQSSELNALSDEDRQRVLTVLNGLHFEITKTHTQYKVVWDDDLDRVYVVEHELFTRHVCIPRPPGS